jgi:CHAT domain-containing protein/tetratricopeptide (TPR) repeat protein
MLDTAPKRRTPVAALVVLLTVRLLAQDGSQLTVARSQADAARSRGQYREAERIARGAYESIQRELPERVGDLADARDLLVEMATIGGDAASPVTLAMAEEAVEARRRLPPPDLAMSRALHNLGDVYFQRGEFQKALPLHEAGLALRRRLLPSGDEAEADSLERLARVEMRMERYSAARSHLDQAIAVRERRQSIDPLALASSLELSAWLDRYAGNYETARHAHERSRALRGIDGSNGIEPTTSIELSGDLLMLEGAVAGAHAAWLKGVRVATELLGPDHPLVAALDRRLALAAAAMGNRQESIDYLADGMRIAEARLAPCDPERMGLMDYAASSLMYDGRFIEAHAQYEAVLKSCRACLGETHANTATVTSNLASLAVLMGDLPEAERLNRHSIAVWSRARPDHPYVAQGLDALAEVVAARGQLNSARILYERALAIRRRINPGHPNVAWTLTNLARVTADSGNRPLALQYLARAKDIYDRVGDGGDPDQLARALMLRGELLTQRGTYAGGQSSLAEALKARERFFGPVHPLTAQARAALARSDWAAGGAEAALAGSLTAEASGRDHMRSTVRYLPERLALAYAANRPEGLSVALSIAAEHAAPLPSLALDAMIRSRSLVLDELAARRPSIAHPGVASSLALLTATRQRFANLMLRSMEGRIDPVTARMLEEASRQRDEAERALATESAEFRSELNRRATGLEEVRRALPPRTALISFVRYSRIVRAPRATREVAGLADAPARVGPTVVPSYLAFVVQPDQVEPTIIPLGSAAIVDRTVKRWRESMLADVGVRQAEPGAPSFRALGASLRRLVWEPLTAPLTGISRVFIVPDGDLNLVPFAALPIGATSYLLEQGPLIHYLSAERDLVTLSIDAETTGTGLLAFGGAAFSDVSSMGRLRRDSATPGISPSLIRGTPFSTCRPFQAVRFRDLPASLREAQAVADLWRQATDQTASTTRDLLLSGGEATETAFKTLGPGRRIIHLATHAFVIDDECDAGGMGLRGAGGLVSSGTLASNRARKRSTIDNPLLLSGLALAGANRRATARAEDDDGILTAEEVAALDLSGVEWAVLSACDTGLGEIRAGEGVFGLRRSFQVAGVRTVVMSLWGVEDQATRIWMEGLYRARLVDGLGTAESVREASMSFIRERRAKGQSTHPFYWAGFVAAGDWR